jgi:hypothetical protein
MSVREEEKKKTGIYHDAPGEASDSEKVNS